MSLQLSQHEQEGILAMLEKGRDDPQNWTWDDDDMAEWEPLREEDRYRAFYDFWRGRTFPTSTFPYELELGSSRDGFSLLPFHAKDTSEGKIIVTESYDELYNRIMLSRFLDMYGVVITGQPGIGKTTFLKYMLARLISQRQVVLLYNVQKIYLFFDGEVYRRDAHNGFEYLPMLIEDPSYSLWALIDMDDKVECAPVNITVWPIQVSSPTPVRWKNWVKQMNGNASVVGLRLWTLDELIYGSRLYPKYKKFRAELETALRGSQPTPISKTNAWVAAEVVKKICDDAKSMATDDEDGICLTYQGIDVDEALRLLISDATAEIGFVARDVYTRVFLKPRTAAQQQADALVDAHLNNLPGLVLEFASQLSLPNSSISHRIVAVHPTRGNVFDDDTWNVTFKSTRIREQATELMKTKEDKYLRHQYRVFHGFAAGSSFAFWLFEMIAHRILSGIWSLGPSLEQATMLSDGSDPGRSTLPAYCFSSAGAKPTHILSTRREMTSVDFSNLQQTLLIDDRPRYYVPRESGSNPLFDSFTIDFKFEEYMALISVYQIAMSESRRGSDEDYVQIQKIIRLVRQYLADVQKSGPPPEKKMRTAKTTSNVKVEFILVCSSNLATPSWQMPEGWNDNFSNDNFSVNDNKSHGDVRCLRVFL